MAIVWSGGQSAFRSRVGAKCNENRVISRSRRRLQIEAFLQGIAVVIVLFSLCAVLFSGIHSLSTRSVFAVTPVTVPMTVHPGDSLWSLAHRYGNPAAPQLERVDALARANGLDSGSTLVPGQRLLVPVENQVEVDHLQTVMASR